MKKEKKFIRITEHRRRYIIDQVNKYSKQIGTRKDQIPKVVLTVAEVKAMPLEYTEGRRTSSRRYLGVCFRNARTIFINAKLKQSTDQLRDTIIHELVHYRFPYLKHGKEYQRRIKLIEKGKHYPEKNIEVKSIEEIRYQIQMNEEERLIQKRLEALELEQSQKDEVEGITNSEYIRNFNDYVAKHGR